MNLGENIFRLRSERNMSQGDLADALNVSRQSVSKWENNNAVPDLDKMLKMAELFGVTLDVLVKGEDSPALSQVPQPQTILIQHNPIPARKIFGIILVCFAVLILLMTLWATSLSAILSCLLISAPIMICGIVCLRAKRLAWLYCLLTIYFWLWLPMGIFAPSYIVYSGARVAQMLHIFWGLWLICGGTVLKKQGKFFIGRKAAAFYYFSLAVTVFFSLLILLFPGLLPTPGLLHS